MGNFSIDEITFNEGSKIDPGKSVIFVGPNNAGKSRALKDILEIASVPGGKNPVVVSDLKVSGPTNFEELTKFFPNVFSTGENTLKRRALTPDLLSSANSNIGGVGYQNDQIRNSVKANLATQDGFKDYTKIAIGYLPTDNRLSLLSEVSLSGNPENYDNILQQVYSLGTIKEKEISDAIESHFGQQVRLDFTNSKSIKVRIAEDFDDVPIDPRDAFEPMQKRALLSEQGDGLRSFASLVFALAVIERPILIVDEPELFLHPPQAYQVGRMLARWVKSERQLFISTHSSDFLRGYLSENLDVAIVRIGRSQNQNSFKQFDSSRITEILKSPLLSSAKVLEGLFYTSAIVVESDSDARFYSAALHKLNDKIDLHSVSADNKQTVSKICHLYQDMGITFAGIVDFDILCSESELVNAMIDFGVDADDLEEAKRCRLEIASEVDSDSPAVRLELFRTAFEKIKKALSEINESELDKELKILNRRANEAANTTKPWMVAKKSGKRILSSTGQNAFCKIENILSKYGFFIFPLGELEAALDEYGIDYTTDKRAWIVRALTLIKGLEVDESKEFWKFLKGLRLD